MFFSCEKYWFWQKIIDKFWPSISDCGGVLQSGILFSIFYNEIRQSKKLVAKKWGKKLSTQQILLTDRKNIK